MWISNVVDDRKLIFNKLAIGETSESNSEEKKEKKEQLMSIIEIVLANFGIDRNVNE